MNRADLGGVYDDKDRLTAFLLAGGGTMNIPAGQLDRFLIRHRAKLKKGSTRARATGDSWAAGNGASAGSKAFYALLKATFGADLVFSNFGYAGRPIHGYHAGALIDGTDAASVNLLQIQRDDLAFCVMGLNDVKGVNYNAATAGGCGSDPKNFTELQAKSMGHAAWMCIPEANKVRMHTANNSGPNPAVTFSGAWTHTGYNNFANFSYCATIGASASAQVVKGDLLVIWNGKANAGTGQCKVTVDGVVYEGWNTQASYDDWSPSCYFLRLPTNGTHTVTVTQASAGLCMIDAFACVDTSTDFGGAFLYSGPCHLLDAAGIGWALGATANSATANGVGAYVDRGVNNGGCDNFAAALDEGMSQLFDWGFNIVNTRARVGFNPNTYISAADSMHPNDLGHSHLYSAKAHPLALLTL